MAIVADCYYSNSYFPRRMTPLIESWLTRRAGLARKLLLKWCGSSNSSTPVPAG